jgi:CRP/FNR family cyclic AMP-dependent transcriptional regulator
MEKGVGKPGSAKQPSPVTRTPAMHEIDRADENIDILRLFNNIRTFTTLPEKDIRALIKSGKFRMYEPGEVLINEGEYDCWVYFLISGQLEIVKGGKAIGLLQRNGDMFGEMGVIDGSPIRALTKSYVLGLDASYLDQKQKTSDLSFCYIIYRLFAEVLAVRLRDTTEENIKLRQAISKIGHINY